MRITDISEVYQTRTLAPYENDKLNDAIDIVRKESPMAWKKYYEDGIEIYRGMQRKPSVLYQGDSGAGRTSAYTSNHFNLILDWLPNWSHIPKRSQSWICSTSSSTASDYGTSFVSLPDNDVEIAFCTEVDFWMAFRNTMSIYDIGELSEFNNKFEMLFTDSSSDEMIEQIKLFDKLGTEEYIFQNPNLEIHKLSLAVGPFRNTTIAFFDDIVQQNGSLMKGLEHLFDPVKNGITVHNFRDLTSKEVVHNVECWFAGPAHFINMQPRREITSSYHESVSDHGTFIGIKLSNESDKQLEKWCHQHDLNCEDFHITLVFDATKKISYDPVDVSITLDPNTFRFEVFDGVLVLRFDNGLISKKHQMLRNKYDISWDYDEYKPHITLDYEWGKSKPDFEVPKFPIELSHEYKEGFDK